MGKLIDLTNKKIARLLVIERAYNKNNIIIWKCVCECGEICYIDGHSLRRGDTKSCGCLQKEYCNKPKYYDRELAIKKWLYSNKKKEMRKYEGDLLSFEAFNDIISKNCFYCNKPPSNTIKLWDRSRFKKERDMDLRIYYNGLDRIDSKKGYLIDNIVPCCKRCNYAKNDMTIEEFKELIKSIYNYFINK